MTQLLFTVSLLVGIASFFLKFRADRRPNTAEGQQERIEDLLEAKVAIVIATLGMILAFVSAIYNIMK